MASMWKRAMLYLGLGPDDEYDDLEAYETPAQSPARAPQMVPGPAPYPEPESGGAVRPLPGSGPVGQPQPVPRPRPVRPVSMTSARVEVVGPRSFNDAQEVADKFKNSQPVIVNLQSADRDLSRRLIDFISGLCYGLGGQMERVAHNVYLLTPTNVEVSPEEKRRLQERGLYDEA